jgi:hypothetical protein
MVDVFEYQLLTEQEGAQILRCSPATVYRCRDRTRSRCGRTPHDAVGAPLTRSEPQAGFGYLSSGVGP